MSRVNVRVDMRPFVTSIRNTVKNRYIESVNTPGVKTEIYTKLYELASNDIPVDTGALQMSPLTGGSETYMGESRYRAYSGVSRYAYGYINDTGIMFDPFSVDENGEVVHYANAVSNFAPWLSIENNKAAAYEAIRNIIVKEMQNG